MSRLMEHSRKHGPFDLRAVPVRARLDALAAQAAPAPTPATPETKASAR
jgi:hypothetical protein